jgi:hypothetical protein
MKNTLTSIMLIALVITISSMTACTQRATNGISVSGHIYDERDGKPIKNALVQVEQTGTFEPPGISVKPGDPTPVLPPNNPVMVKSKTAGDGSYDISGLSPGYYSVTITAAQYNKSLEDIVVTDNSTTIDFTLYRSSSISGHVYRAEDDKPLAGAEIQVLVFITPYEATSDADGSYTIDGLQDKLWVVMAGAKGYVTKYYAGSAGTYIYEKWVEVATQYGTDTTNIDFVLERGGSITGQIYEPDGVTPAADAHIEYQQTSGITTPELFRGMRQYHLPKRVEADSIGRYSITERLTGTYELWAIRYSDDKASSHVEVSVVMGQNTIQDFILSE